MTPIDRVESLREDLAEEESELRLAVVELENAARKSMQPRDWIRRKPLAAAGGAFLLGWWIGCR